MSKARFAGQKQRPLDLVKEPTVRTCSVASSMLAALISSTWAKAPRKSSYTLITATCTFSEQDDILDTNVEVEEVEYVIHHLNQTWAGGPDMISPNENI